jgi:NAD(P)-dependent dehydrogenase (short-subunit alcohol dehydrogenase family)
LACGWSSKAYSQSKLANVLFTYELARRLDGTGVTATVLHPGVVRTRFAAEDPSPVLKAFLPLIRLFLKTPEKGAATSIYLASSPEVDGVTGRYFADRKPKTSSRSSYDTAAAARLWQISLDLVARTD